MEFDTCYASDRGLEWLCEGCPYLKKLNLSKNSKIDSLFTDAAVYTIVSHCPKIEILSLNSWCEITDISIAYLLLLPLLREIDLSDCNLLTNTALCALLQGNRALQGLILKDFTRETVLPLTSFVDTTLLACISSNCPNLTKLRMHIPEESNVTDASVAGMLQGCPLLEDFGLESHNGIHSIVAALASYCPRLKRLYLDSVRITDEDMTYLCQSCPELLSLELIYCSQNLTDETVSALSTYCHKLQEFSIISCDHITDASLCALFKSCTDLTSVHLILIPRMTDLSIITLLQCCPRLHTLRLCSNRLLTDQCMTSISTFGKSLTTLQLAHIQTLSDESLIQASHHCKVLEKINLASCTLISERPVKALLSNCSNLRELQVVDCESVHVTSALKAECKAIAQRYRGPRILWKLP